MKAILEFNLPEDIELYSGTFHGPRWKDLVEEYVQWLRSVIKFTDDDTLLDAATCREKLFELMAEAGLSLEA